MNMCFLEEHLGLRVREGWWDRIQSKAIWSGDVAMLVLDPRTMDDSSDNSKYGRVFGQVDGM
jgi:hypothetical protein